MPAQAVSVDSATSATGTVALTVSKALSLAVDGASALSATMTLLGRTQALAAAPRTALTATADVSGASDATTLAVTDAVREILLLWGIEDIARAPDFAKRRAINDLNAAMQTVWNQAKDRDYWTRTTITSTFAISDRSNDLGNTVQNVVGPARLSNRQTLVPCHSRGEIDNFELAFLGADSRTRTDATPVAYFVERIYQSGTEPAKCVLHIAPAPDVETVVSLDVVNETPRYTLGDICAGTLLPIPHKYVETLLLPVARMKAMSCHLFIAEDRRKDIEADYMLASAQFDGADPAPSKKPRPERKEAAA